MTNKQKKQSTKDYLIFLETFPEIEQKIKEKYNIKNAYQFESDLDFLNGIWPDEQRETNHPRNDLIFNLFAHFMSGLFAAKFHKKDINDFLINELAPSLSEDYKIIINKTNN